MVYMIKYANQLKSYIFVHSAKSLLEYDHLQNVDCMLHVTMFTIVL